MVEHIVVAVGIGIALVFSLGLGLGILIMVAMPVRPGGRRYRRPGPLADWPSTDPGPDDEEPDEPAWWHARGGFWA